MDIVAEEDDREMLGERGGRVTKYEIQMYVKSDRQEEVIPIT